MRDRISSTIGTYRILPTYAQKGDRISSTRGAYRIKYLPDQLLGYYY